jgi:hypothetical protein
MRKFCLLFWFVQSPLILLAQVTAPVKDSVVVRIHPTYNKPGKLHRTLFGENYRKEWAIPVKLPLIRISAINGGLTPLREGGGMQSKSLRLLDQTGSEWVLRSVEKSPDKLLPPQFQGTFAVDWLDDGVSSQHPLSALIVPPMAAAAGIPHSTPVIGVVAPDTALGNFGSDFAGKVVLLEAREPLGKSDNTFKMLENLKSDHDNSFDGDILMRARMLDVLVGDWDRHEDQWRWAFIKSGNNKRYIPVPRDRDQVFHVLNGLGPSLAKWPWIHPMFDHFGATLPRIKYSLFKTRFIQAYPDAQFNYDKWMQIAHDFASSQTDSVMKAALKRLPPESDQIRHDELLSKLKNRRNELPSAMDRYYRFINKTVDLRISNKDETVKITDTMGTALNVQIYKRKASGAAGQKLMDVNYRSDITKEIRIYLEDGTDDVIIKNSTSPIKLRIIGRTGLKRVDLVRSPRMVKVYGRKDGLSLIGNTAKISSHLSNDTLNTRFVQNDPYNIWMPLASVAINADDGFLLGAGFRYTQKDGFRKLPYATMQELLVSHSFDTEAFRIRYRGEWTEAVGKADILINAFVQAPNNTLNFFGKGNETSLDKFPGYRRYHRTRYNTYQLDASLRWHLDRKTTFSTGLSFQHFSLDKNKNAGRFITTEGAVMNSYDSVIYANGKLHAGITFSVNRNSRDNDILPAKGYYFDVAFQSYIGLNGSSRDFLQVRPQLTYYFSLNNRSTIVLSDRIGGGVSFGAPAFYQSMFLGGNGNLLGYLGNRFAGDHMLYNNLQGRIKLFNIASYVLPGQMGLTGFFDSGRVWARGESSDQWHTGYGGGLYFSPARLTVIQALAGYSKEGWYPYVSIGLRL